MKTPTKIIIIVSVVAIILVIVFWPKITKAFKKDDKTDPGKDPGKDPGTGNSNNNNTNKPIVVTPSKVKSPTTNITTYNALIKGSIPITSGQKSKMVYLLQFILNALNNANLTLDGDFGTNTTNALIAFTGNQSVDFNLLLALNAEMQKNKNKITSINFYFTEGNKIFKSYLPAEHQSTSIENIPVIFLPPMSY